MSKVSCLIPAYNEGARLAGVLDIATKHPLIAEVIVIDDGSSDNTPIVVLGYEGVKFIRHSQNRGKSQALCTGIKEASEDLILMLDADLIGLTLEDLSNIINPVLNKESDIGMSMVRNSPYRLIGLDFLSGQRVLPKKMFLDNLEEIMSLPNFGIEVFLNNLIIRDRQTIRLVTWPKAVSPFKFMKYGFVTGMLADIKMNIDILKTITLRTAFRQIVQMLKLRV